MMFQKSKSSKSKSTYTQICKTVLKMTNNVYTSSNTSNFCFEFYLGWFLFIIFSDMGQKTKILLKNLQNFE